MYMDQNIQDFPKEFKDLVRKCGEADILIGTDSTILIVWYGIVMILTTEVSLLNIFEFK